MKSPQVKKGDDIEKAVEKRIRKEMFINFSKHPTRVTKIGTEAFLVKFRTGMMKVRVSYPMDTKRRWPSFLRALEIHKQLQDRFPEIPKIIKYVDRSAWKFKFVEWVEGSTFSSISKRSGGFTKIPEEYFYKFGRFMFKLKKLGIYGNDWQSSHALYRPDMDVVIFCDLGTWSLSRDRRVEIPFLNRFLGSASLEQKGRFYDGFRGGK